MSEVLAGLDGVPWAGLSHAYGTAEDVPGLLRAMTDPGRAAEALGRLDAAIYHQGGGVYPAGAAAVPFLIGLACDPRTPYRPDVLELLARFAELLTEVREPWASLPAAVTCRQHVEAGAEALLALLDDADGRVRLATVEVAAALPGRAERVVRLLMARAEREDEQDVQVALILAAGDLGARGVLSPPEATLVRDWLRGRGHDLGDPLHLAVLVARNRLSPGSVSVDAFINALDALDALDDPALTAGAYLPNARTGAGLGAWVCRELGDDRVARTGLARYLLSPRRPVPAEGFAGVGAVMMRWRSATTELLPHLVRLLDDPVPERRAAAAHLLAAAGQACRPYADRLAALAAAGDGSASACAVWALARLGDRQAVPYLNATLRGEVPRFAVSGTHFYGDWYWLDQMPALEDVLEPMVAHAESLMQAIRWRLRRVDSTPALYGLSEVLSSYGPRAAPAVPELVHLLDGDTAVMACNALGAIGPPALRAAPRLATLARGRCETEPAHPAQAAAWALFRITGDPHPLLDRLDLAAGYHTRHDLAGALAALGPLAARHADRVAEILTSNPNWWTNWQGVELAHAHWRLTGDPLLCLRVFDAALAPLRSGRQLPVIRRVLGYLPPLGSTAGRYLPLLRQVVEADERLTDSGGWRGIAEDDQARLLAAQAIEAISS